MDKRERVITTLECDQADICPIHYLGFEKTASAYQSFLLSSEYQASRTILPFAGDITIPCFFQADTWVMDPFYDQIHYWYPTPPEFPEYKLSVHGRLYKTGKNTVTNQDYMWYEQGYYTTEERIREMWEKYGKPSEYMLQGIDYNAQTWKKYVDELSPYLFPMARLTVPMHEALFEGMTLGRLSYYMRKRPSYIHDVIGEYLKTNLKAIAGLADAHVEVIFYYDDLGQRDRSILSLGAFQEFILPYYKILYDACRKRGIFIVQHSCGFIDDFLPLMVDEGLSAIQALEPAAGVNLAALKEKLGDQIAFLGGMDSSRILNFGSIDEIYGEVKRCMKVAGSNGGYFAGPSHELLNVPWQNVLALRDAIAKYRAYPFTW
jgi:hypothetical protein